MHSDSPAKPAHNVCRLAGVIAFAAALAFIGSQRAFGDESGDTDNRRPQTLVIGLDLSQSNPLVSSHDYAASVADYIADEIDDLPLASKVMIRTFGSYSGQQNALRIDRDVSSEPEEKPAAVADLVRTIIGNVPTLVREGRVDVQDRTNIVGFLENISQLVDCQDTDTTIVLASDGIEDSEYARLIQPDSSLPPADPMFRGCAMLEIVGLGQGAKSPSLTEHLRTEWARWAKEAGFKEFSGLNSW
jgi:hypothetical protein